MAYYATDMLINGLADVEEVLIGRGSHWNTEVPTVNSIPAEKEDRGDEHFS